jgi:hypothetical protein
MNSPNLASPIASSTRTIFSPLGTLLLPEDNVSAGRAKGWHCSAGWVALGLEGQDR